MALNLERLKTILERNKATPPESAVDVMSSISYWETPERYIGEGGWASYRDGYQERIAEIKVLYNLSQQDRQSRATFDEEFAFLLEQQLALQTIIQRATAVLQEERAQYNSFPTKYSLQYRTLGIKTSNNKMKDENKKTQGDQIKRNRVILKNHNILLKDLILQLSVYRQILENRPPPSLSPANEENPRTPEHYPGVPSTAVSRTNDPQPTENNNSNDKPTILGGRRKIRKQTKKVRKHRRRRTSRS